MSVFYQHTYRAFANCRSDSIFNPKSGYIKADSVKELTMDSSRIDPERTVTDIKEIGK